MLTTDERYDRMALVRWCAMAEIGDADDCWLWTGSLRGGGYGSFGYRETHVSAHRWGYEMLVGPVAPEHDLHHVCETPRCVNPRHLVALSRRDHWAATPRHNTNKRRCKRGHPLAGDNVRINGSGARICKACERMRGVQRRSPRERVPVGLHPTLAVYSQNAGNRPKP